MEGCMVVREVRTCGQTEMVFVNAKQLWGSDV